MNNKKKKKNIKDMLQAVKYKLEELNKMLNFQLEK